MGNLFHAHQLEHARQPLFSAYYYKQWNNYEMSFHQHASVEIMYVINGVCHIELLAADASEPTLLQMKKGEFILLDGKVPHRLLVTEEGGCRMLNVEFTFQEGSKQVLPTISELAEQSEELAYLLRHIGAYVVLRDVDEVYATLKSLVLELDQQLDQGSLKQELLFTQLMLLIAGLYRASADSAPRVSAAQHYVRQVQSYIQQHYDGTLTVQQLAQSVNVHPNYLQRVFRAETGTTIIHYLNQFRLDKAMMLLRETDIAITDICEFVGINSRQYFHELFKKHTGLTPVQYREQSNRQYYSGRKW